MVGMEIRRFFFNLVVDVEVCASICQDLQKEDRRLTLT